MSGDFGKENKSGQVERKLKLSGDRMHGMIDKKQWALWKVFKSWHRTEPPRTPTHTCNVNENKTRPISLVPWRRKINRSE
jgi:hypothetical protein